MEAIERYIYAVARQLPSNQRAEVEKELAGLIQDMLAERTQEKPAKKDIEAVLLELGEPSLLAERYRGSKRFLIGPNYFDTYLTLLKIVLFAVTLGITVAITVGYVVNPPQFLWEALGNYVSAILGATAQVFAGITVVFAVLEYYQVNLSDTPEKKWVPADLPKVPAKAALIRPLEPIFAIVFAVFLIILLNAANQLIGIYFTGQDSQVTVIPLFDKEVFRSYLPYFNVLLVVAIGKECLKLITGKWTLGLAGINIIHNVASLLVVIIAFSNAAIWNGGLQTFILESGVAANAADLERLWNLFARGLMGVVAFALILDSIVSLAKALKHRIASYL